LVLTLTADPIETLDPAFAYDSGSGWIIFNIYETLIFWDGDKPDKFVPMLSTAVPSLDNGLIKDDGKTYVFPIRKGIKFHDGAVKDPQGNVIPGSGELTPDDVTYSIQRLLLEDRSGGPSWLMMEPLLGSSSIMDFGFALQPGSKAIAASVDPKMKPAERLKATFSPETLKAICDQVKSAVTVDGDNVAFHLKGSFAPFLQVVVGYWASILDKEWVMMDIHNDAGALVKKAGWDGNCGSWPDFYDPDQSDSSLYSIANGTGPYKFIRWRPNEEIYLERDDGYWRERPANLKYVSFKFSPELSTRLLMLQNGDADIVTIPLASQDQVEPLVQKELVSKYENQPTGSAFFWIFNQKISMTDNPYVGSGKLDGDGIPADFFSDLDVRQGFGFVFDWQSYLQNAIHGEGTRFRGAIESSVFGYNPEQPVFDVDLDKAKEHFQKAFGGQLWDKGFKFIVPYVQGGQAVKLTTQIMAKNLASINPKFQLISQDFQNNKISQDGDLGKIPMDYNGWSEDYHDPNNWVFPILDSNGYYARNMGMDPTLQSQLDDMIVKARGELNPETRKEIYFELQKIAYDKALIIPLEEWHRRRYTRSWLHGYLNNTAFPDYYFWYFSKS
jgi:peptide/nickel transport system substrate-binding protein